MPMMDEFREEREKIKQAPPKEKLKYFWCYYKWHTIVCVAAAVILGTWIHDVATRKDTAFFAAMLNTISLAEEEESTFIQDYADYAKIDLNEYEVLVDTTMSMNDSATDEMSISSSQRMMAYTAAGELDVLIGGADIFSSYANADMFWDMREFLTEEQIEQYEPYFYYVDQAVVEQLEVAQSDPEYVMNPTPITIPNPYKPEDMERPIPVGLFVTDSECLSENYAFYGDFKALGVMLGSSHTEATQAFIDYLYAE